MDILNGLLILGPKKTEKLIPLPNPDLSVLFGDDNANLIHKSLSLMVEVIKTKTIKPGLIQSNDINITYFKLNEFIHFTELGYRSSYNIGQWYISNVKLGVWVVQYEFLDEFSFLILIDFGLGNIIQFDVVDECIANTFQDLVLDLKLIPKGKNQSRIKDILKNYFS